MISCTDVESAGLAPDLQRFRPCRRFSLTILVAIFVGCLVASCCARPLRAAQRPNVVLILADDQAFDDFGFMGNSVVHTPHLDRLAARSAVFTNGYVPMSVCRPSLATLLTGLYPHQHGIHFNHPPPGLGVMKRTMTSAQYRQARSATDALIGQVPTLPRILASHGYACLQTGKHWEGSYRTAGFTDGMTLGRPADRRDWIAGTRQQANGDWVAHGNGDAGLLIGRETMEPIRRFISKHGARKPFFVWYAPFLPHLPFDAPPEFHALYEGAEVPAHLKPYYAEIARFDATVGRLLGMLEQQGLADNTFIVFASDNGFRPRVDQPHTHDPKTKFSEFESGLRTPVLVSIPGRTSAGRRSELVSTVDIVPTILSAVGLGHEVTARMPGRDLCGLVEGSPRASGRWATDRAVFGAIYPNDASVLGQPSRHVRARWVRQGDFKLLLPGAGKRPIARALFDLASDPAESNNLVSSPDHAQRVTELTAALDAWWTATDDHAVTRAR